MFAVKKMRLVPLANEYHEIPRKVYVFDIVLRFYISVNKQIETSENNKGI
jgi:hypothetical protein